MRATIIVSPQRKQSGPDRHALWVFMKFNMPTPEVWLWI
jgi:hypothetical protein